MAIREDTVLAGPGREQLFSGVLVDPECIVIIREGSGVFMNAGERDAARDHRFCFEDRIGDVLGQRHAPFREAERRIEVGSFQQAADFRHQVIDH